MKRLLLITSFLFLLNNCAKAQQYEVSMSQLCFNNCPYELHMIAWIDTLTTTGIPHAVKGSISGTDGIGVMNPYHLGAIDYRFTFNPVEYFDSVSTNIVSIGFTFRDACGNPKSFPCAPDTIIIDINAFTQDSIVNGSFKIKKINRPLYKLTYTGFTFGNNNYFHSGIELNMTGNQWAYEVGTWASDDGIGQMAEDNINLKTYIYLDLPTYYSQQISMGSALAESETVSKIFFRIRNETGNPYFNDTASIDFSTCPPSLRGNFLNLEIIPASGTGSLPSAAVNASTTQILSGSDVTFSDNSSGSPSKWLWTFYDGNPYNSVAQLPADVNYANAGCKPVMLTVYNENGCNSFVDSCFISVRNVAGELAADFRADKTLITPGEAVSFTDMSTDNPNSWNWKFTNAATPTSPDENPSDIVFTELGCHEVQLTASNGTHTDSISKSCFINVDYCQPKFVYDGTGGTDHIDYFRMGELSYTSSNSCSFCYHPEEDTTVMYQGLPYDIDMFFSASNPAGYVFNFFLDANRDGIFDMNENVLPFNYNNANSAAFVKTVTLPSPLTGITRMRLVMGTPMSFISGCPVIHNAGEVIDFNVDIQPLNGYCGPSELYDPFIQYKTYIDAVQLGNIQNTSTGLAGNPDGSIGPLAPHYTVYPLTTQLTEGVLSTINITAGGDDSLARISAWIDFNQDGDFYDIDEKIAAIDLDQLLLPFTPQSISFITPFGSLLGNTQMRVRSHSGIIPANPDPCGENSFGETEDYTVEILSGAPCTGIVNPGNTLASVDSACDGIAFVLSLQNQQTGTGITYIWYVDSGFGWQVISGNNQNTLLATQSNGTLYRCEVICSAGGTAISGSIYVGQSPFYNCYCASTAASYDGEEITFVGISNLASVSGCFSTGGPGSILNSYSDYTTIFAPAPLKRDSSYDFTLMIDECVTPGNGFTVIYIDFNHNSVFDEPDEKVFSSFTSVAGPHSEVGSIYVPDTALSGLTRMRIINGPFPINSACGEIATGETEDYLVKIGEPPIADFSASSNTILLGNPVTFTDQSINEPTTWLWTFSGGTPPSSASQIPSAVTWSATGCYDVSLEVSNEFGTSVKDSICMITVITGMEDITLFNQVKLFPNPANTNLHVAINSELEVSSIRIYNSIGQLSVIPFKTVSDQFNFNTSAFAEGLYSMQIQTNKGTISRKFIIQRQR